MKPVTDAEEAGSDATDRGSRLYCGCVHQLRIDTKKTGM